MIFFSQFSIIFRKLFKHDSLTSIEMIQPTLVECMGEMHLDFYISGTSDPMIIV